MLPLSYFHFPQVFGYNSRLFIDFYVLILYLLIHRII